jgi:hypothetical protein
MLPCTCRNAIELLSEFSLKDIYNKEVINSFLKDKSCLQKQSNHCLRISIARNKFP